MKLALGLLFFALSFPAMLAERLTPMAPKDAFLPERDRSWFHDIKDEAMWRIKGDVQWFVKFFCFVICVLLVALGVAAIF